MAPILQCPDCGTKHPLDDVPDTGSFACRGCGRVLKVPESVGNRARGGQPAPAPTPADVVVPPTAPNDTAATRALPTVTTNRSKPTSPSKAQPASAPGVARPALGSVPWWMRLLLWVVAIPIGFVLVFFAARVLGYFTSAQLSDLFLASSRNRFWPVARLLPFVALVIALLVQGGVYAIARLRARRSGAATPTRSSGE